MNPVEAILQPAESANLPELRPAGTLCALMEFYESGEVMDEGESEIDLMIQLSGMVHNDMRSDE